MTLHRLPLLLLLLVSSHSLPAQLSGWSYKAGIAATETSGVARTNYQIRYVFDSQALIGAGKLQANGEDLRFGDSCAYALYPYWIESGINTASTVVWILVPSLPASTTTGFCMFYGNPAAPDGNDFPATFPAAIRTNGNNLTITGSLTPDFVWAEANDTIFLTAGATLTLSNVRKVKVAATGQINGVGRGFQAPPINTVGTGTGGGGTSGNAGCGGGSYAGIGGTGGLDGGDAPGTGGPAYGTAAGADCDMGSSGGSGTTLAASGGGALSITAEYVEIDGSIHMTGGVAVSDINTSRGGGGGAGGCIKIICADATGTGALMATGSNGAAGTSTNNDSGGGGGGGRIKTWSASLWPGGMTMSVVGGLGGPFGTSAPGQPGSAGSISNLVQAFPEVNPTIVTGPENAVTVAEITGTGTVICPGDSLLLTASDSMTAYFWTTGDTTPTTTVTIPDTYYLIVIDTNNCLLIDSVIVVAVATLPVTIAGNGTVCAGDCDTLTATVGFDSYLWSTVDTTATIIACISGTYSVQATDSNGCTVSDTFVVTVLPALSLSLGPDATVCDGNLTLLDASGSFVHWQWSTGDTTPTITVTTSNTYSVTVTDANNCEASDAVVITYVPLPNPVITQIGNQLMASPNYPLFQWLFNGSPIPGAYFQTHTATGTGVYSVQAVDSNGCLGTSDTLFVITAVEQPMTFGAVLAPNPVSSATQLRFHLTAASEVDVKVMDALGKVIIQRSFQGKTGENRLELQMTDAAPGVYYVQVSDGNARQILRLLKK